MEELVEGILEGDQHPALLGLEVNRWAVLSGFEHVEYGRIDAAGASPVQGMGVGLAWIEAVADGGGDGDGEDRVGVLADGVRMGKLGVLSCCRGDC